MPRLEDRCWTFSCAPSETQGDRQDTQGDRQDTQRDRQDTQGDRQEDTQRDRQDTGAADMMSLLTAVLRGAQLARRGLVLFSVGVVLALVLNLLQVQRHVTLFPGEDMLGGGTSSLFSSSAWWIPPCCGTGAAVIGLLYPCIDRHLGEPHQLKREWASVMRCIAVFVGINHASVKLDFANNVQLSLTLAALSLGLWWTFDRSRSGFGLGVTTAFLATVFTQLLVYNGVYQYTSPDFLYVRSWLPCIFFSGGVTMGNIGRQLAMGGVEKPHSD